MHASRSRRALLLLATVLMSLAAGAHSRVVVVFEAGSGEAVSSQYSQQAFVIMDQGPDGEVVETLMTVETWAGPTSSSLNILTALNQLLRPVSWVYQQLEAIDALQQATINTFLMRHNEASLEGRTQAEQAEVQEDLTLSNMEQQLHHLGCKRFSAAMDEYVEGLWLEASSASAALDIQAVVDVVERSNSLYELQGQLLARDQQEPGEETAARAVEVSEVLHTEEMIIITSSSDADSDEWDALEVVTDAQQAYQDYLMDMRKPKKHHHLDHELQVDEKSPGPLLRGTSHWWSSREDTEQDVELVADLLDHVASEVHSSAAGDEDSDDAFQPFIDLLVRQQSQHVQLHHTDPPRLHSHHSAGQHQSDRTSSSFQAFEADGSDVYSFEELPPLLHLGNDRDWPLLLMLSLAASAVAVAFVVSWKQLQAALHKGRHLSVPVMVKHEGRLVWAVVVVSENEVVSDKHAAMQDCSSCLKA